jgi:hypothetical protein
VLTSDGADADAAEREDAGRNRGLADHLDDLAYVDDGIEIGGVLDREMRHGVIIPRRRLRSGEKQQLTEPHARYWLGSRGLDGVDERIRPAPARLVHPSNGRCVVNKQRRAAK